MSRYVATDWHGVGDIADKILDFLKPEDELYFLGDAIDRGPNGIYIMYKLLRDKRVIYLKGNHEDMFAEYVPDFIEGHFASGSFWLGDNGGKPTWQECERLTDSDKLLFCRLIKKMPQRLDIINTKGQHIILSHAGCDPWVTDYEAALLGIKFRYLWDRKHIHTNHEYFREEEWQNTYVIHGHTPVLAKDFCGDEDVVLPVCEEIKAVHYADGHKICLDLYTVGTGRAVLFDLDTFEEIYFDITDKEE